MTTIAMVTVLRVAALSALVVIFFADSSMQIELACRHKAGCDKGWVGSRLPAYLTLFLARRDTVLALFRA